jgi:acetyltransferase-like isoleucine patch superfamily enzyme
MLEARNFLRTFIQHCYLMKSFPGLSMAFPSCWQLDNVKAISIGKSVCIGPYSDIVVLASTPYSPIEGKLSIGNGVVIGSGANIRAAGGVIVIGDNALLGQKVSLIAANHQVDNKAPYRDLPWNADKTGVVLEDNVWIGAGVIILPGSTVGKNSVVAAGSVVTKNIPSNQLWAGVPAKWLKSL